jgi:hypothetical protein
MRSFKNIPLAISLAVTGATVFIQSAHAASIAGVPVSGPAILLAFGLGLIGAWLLFAVASSTRGTHMTHRSFVAIIIAAVFMTASPAMAVVIIDQENDGSVSGYNEISTPQWQYFMQAGNNIAGAAVKIDAFNDTGGGTITLSIYDAEPGTGNLIASGSGVAPVGPTLNGDVFFEVFWAAVAVAPETELFMAVTSANGNFDLVTINASPYTRGVHYINGVAQTKKNSDLAFRTYTDDALNDVPEPGALMIFGLGLVVLGMTRRRRSV